MFYFQKCPHIYGQNLSITANEALTAQSEPKLQGFCFVCHLLHMSACLFFVLNTSNFTKLKEISNLSSGSSSLACSLTNFLTWCRNIMRQIQTEKPLVLSS